MDPADDLKAFERRMIEITSSLQPSIWRWRLILLTLVLITLTTLYNLIKNLLFSSSVSTNSLTDNLTDNQSTLSRQILYFIISLCLLIFSFLYGIHRKIFASSIIISRFRYILGDYNMSCDAHGRLIIKPRPSKI